MIHRFFSFSESNPLALDFDSGGLGIGNASHVKIPVNLSKSRQRDSSMIHRYFSFSESNPFRWASIRILCMAFKVQSDCKTKGCLWAVMPFSGFERMCMTCWRVRTVG
jgi:hypothetical protein